MTLLRTDLEELESLTLFPSLFSYCCVSVSGLCSVPELCLFLRDLPMYLQYSFRMVSFSLAKISHNYERKLTDWSVTPKA